MCMLIHSVYLTNTLASKECEHSRTLLIFVLTVLPMVVIVLLSSFCVYLVFSYFLPFYSSCEVHCIALGMKCAMSVGFDF